MLGRLLLSAFLIGIGAAGGALYAQQPAPAAGVKRTPLQRVDVPGSNYEVVFGMAELPAGFKAGRHSHPGPVLAYVMEGEFVLMLDGQTDKVSKSGESLQVPANAVHNEGAGDKPAKLLAVYVIEKGKPLALPVK
jgi:quercetin dioxygenase-like cupin family protein